MKVRYWLPDFLVPTVLLSPLIMDATACACKATWQRPGHRWQARTAGLGHSPTPPSSLCPAWSGPCGPCPVSCAPVPPGAPGAPSVPGVGDLARAPGSSPPAQTGRGNPGNPLFHPALGQVTWKRLWDMHNGWDCCGRGLQHQGLVQVVQAVQVVQWVQTVQGTVEGEGWRLVPGTDTRPPAGRRRREGSRPYFPTHLTNMSKYQ